ncbi:oligogalacturonate-specific porin KdgM family protein [Vibrio sp. SCSIO 43136]|uniref:oligogalacturonate-specific porin KdgM family protein n=1 Tax=Vibrio sp. SCSIO 43136 TaxID=2819101 RepID=UPI002075ED17|nr:oligogalacturonate-specific porin KdgM family protein [Vibrio sp. SCSIO 43136]USD67339.1 hypothetical protein J4N39_22170 [Vibrio sp. SCSIO 43136]
MKAVTTIAALVASTLLAGAASAASLDYRAEYKHEDKDYAHRIKIGDSTKIFDDAAKLSLSVEQKFQSEQNDDGSQDFWNGVSRGDSEFSATVQYKLGDGWYIEPGMPVTFGSNKTTFKPQFRVGYTSSFGLTTALRYRHEFQNFDSSAGTTSAAGSDDKIERAGKTIQQGKITLTGGYKFKDDLKNLKLSWEANYNHNYDNVRLANDKNWEWDAGIKLGYQFDDITPYMELWTSDYGSSAENDRQLKTRVGIKYSF